MTTPFRLSLVAFAVVLQLTVPTARAQVRAPATGHNEMRDRIRESLLDFAKPDVREWLRDAARQTPESERRPMISPGESAISARGPDSVTAVWIAEEPGYGNAITTDASGDIYVAGGEGQFVTMKYDADGTLRWMARCSLGEEARDVASNPAGGVYVAGYARYGLDDEFLTIKYDPDGQQRWISPHNRRTESARDLALDHLGNAYVVGRSGANYATLKYASSGGLLWAATYDGGLADAPSAMVVDTAENIYVTGYSEQPDEVAASYTTIKYSPRGGQLWIAQYSGVTDGWNAASSIALDDSGNVYVAGQSSSDDLYDYALVKYDSSGIQRWAQRYNGGGYDLNPQVIADGAGNIYLSGSSGYSTAEDIVVLKYNSAGMREWSARYDGPAHGSDIADAMAVDKDGSVYVCGSSEGTGTEYDFVTLKYNAAGVLEWIARYDRITGYYDCATDIAIGSHGSVYVTGFSVLGNKSFCTTIRYDQVIPSLSPSGEMESVTAAEQVPGFSLSQNYPNPFNPTTVIRYRLPERAHVTLELFTVLGERAALLVDGEMSAGDHETVLDARSLSSGLYFYRLSADRFAQTRKLFLMK